MANHQQHTHTHLVGCEQPVLVGLGWVQHTVGGGHNRAREAAEINLLTVPAKAAVAADKELQKLNPPSRTTEACLQAAFEPCNVFLALWIQPTATSLGLAMLLDADFIGSCQLPA